MQAVHSIEYAYCAYYVPYAYSLKCVIKLCKQYIPMNMHIAHNAQYAYSLECTACIILLFAFWWGFFIGYPTNTIWGPFSGTASPTALMLEKQH